MSNQIGLKICFNQEIRKVSKAPEDLKSLTEKISLIFAANIPRRWSLQYIDSEGDHITISDELDFQEFLEESKASLAKVFKKIYIVAIPEDQEMIKIIELPQEQEQTETEKNTDFIVVTKDDEDESLKEDSFEILNNNATSEEQEEYPETVPFILEVKQDKGEEQPSVSSTEAKNRNSRRHANKLMKKLAESNLSEPNQRLKGKLREVGKCLSKDQKIDLERKKERLMNHCNQKHPKGRDTFNQAALSSLDSPPSERKIVHQGIRCDGCRQSPMVGVRYKCSQCADFDYCERCEAKLNHPHPFIRVKKPVVADPGSSSHTSSSNKGLQNPRSRQSDKRWKPLPITLTNFVSAFEDDEDEENDYSDAHVNENQHEKVEQTLKRVYASEIQEKVQRLSEIFPERRLQSLYDFVSKAHHLSIEALVERWLLAQPS